MSHPGVEEVGEKNKMRYLIDWAFFFFLSFFPLSKAKVGKTVLL